LPEDQKPQALDKVTLQLKRLPVEDIRLMVSLLDEIAKGNNGQPAPSSSCPVAQRTCGSPSPPSSMQPHMRPRSPTPDSPVSKAARVDKVKAEQISSRSREVGAQQVPSPGRAARASASVPCASASVSRGTGQNRSAGGSGRKPRRAELVELSPGCPVSHHTRARVSEDARRPLIESIVTQPTNSRIRENARRPMIESAVRQPTDSRIREDARRPMMESAVRQPADARILQESGVVRERSRSKDKHPVRTDPLARTGPLARGLREFSQAQKEPKPLAASVHIPRPVRACTAPGRTIQGYATSTPVAPYSESPDRREASRERTRQNHSQCGRAAGQPLAPWRGYVGQPAV